MSFWLKQPVEINNNNNKLIKIFNNEELLNRTNFNIDKSSIKLDYIIHNNIEDRFITFINDNYINSETNILKLIYNKELLELYENSLIIEFRPKGKNTMIGFIIGRKIQIQINKTIEESLEVNFLCIIPKLRKLYLAPYIINILTKESLIKYNIGIANYTIHDNIKAPYFSKKQFYHIPLNIIKLVKCKFFSDNTDLILRLIDISLIYNKFETTDFKLEYLCDNFVEESKVILLYNKLIKYYQETFSIYEYLSIEKFKLLLNNKSFHHFIIYNKEYKVISYICLFNLITLNTENNMSYNNGNVFLMFFDQIKFIQDTFDIINKYILTNNIFDIVSFTDIFPIKIKSIPGSCILKYYLFNTNYNLVENSKNGLITI